MMFVPQNTALIQAAGRVDHRIVWTLGFAVILAFYLATTPGNRIEATDSYVYAYQTEALGPTDFGYYQTFLRLLLFHVVMRLLYRAAQFVHEGVSAHAVMLAASAFSASLCLMLFGRLLNRNFHLTLPTSLLGAGFLGATYGFWRYSVEAEVYAPSLLLIIAVLSLVFSAEERAARVRRRMTFMPAGALAGLAVVFYQLNAIPLLLAAPVLFLRRGGLDELIAYEFAAASVIVFAYVLAFLMNGAADFTIAALYDFVFEHSWESNSWDQAPLLMAVPTLGHAIVSGNWIFGLTNVVGTLSETLPLGNYPKRVLAASRAGVLFVYVPIFTLTVIIVLGIVSAWFARQRFRTQSSLDRRLVFAFSWFVLHSVVLCWLSPANYEVWAMALPPLVILFTAFVIEPCVRAGRQALPTILLVAVVLHNGIGGIGIMYSSRGDYAREKGAWVLEHATAKDLILTTTVDGNLRNLLCYVGQLRVIYLSAEPTDCLGKRQDILQLVERTRKTGGRIFVFDLFFEASPALKVRVPDSEAEVSALAESFRGREQPIFQNDAGTTYQVR